MAQTVAPELFELFKEGLECWNHDELDLMQDMYVEDAVFDVSGVFPDVAPMRGHKQMRRYWNEMRETWDGIRQDPLDAFDLGDGRYVVDVRWWGTGRRSGVEVDQRFAMLYALLAEIWGDFVPRFAPKRLVGRVTKRSSADRRARSRTGRPLSLHHAVRIRFGHESRGSHMPACGRRQHCRRQAPEARTALETPPGRPRTTQAA